MSKRPVYIQVVITKLGEVNTTKECFDAELIIRSRWLDGGDSFAPNLYIENAIGDPPAKVSTYQEQDSTGATFNVESRRLRGSFAKPMDLKNFPFDVQDLFLLIKADQPITDVELFDDSKNMHKIHTKTFIDEQEFIAYKYMATEFPNQTQDAELPRAHRPSIKVSCFVARKHQFFLWNVYLIVLLIGSLSFLTFAADCITGLTARLQLLFTLVLAAIMFKNVVNAQIPKISYLTYIDKFILFTIVFMTILAFWFGISTRISSQATRKSIDPIMLFVFLGIYFLFVICFVVWVVVVPCSVRRKTKRLEEDYMHEMRALKQERVASSA